MLANQAEGSSEPSSCRGRDLHVSVQFISLTQGGHQIIIEHENFFTRNETLITEA